MAKVSESYTFLSGVRRPSRAREVMRGSHASLENAMLDFRVVVGVSHSHSLVADRQSESFTWIILRSPPKNSFESALTLATARRGRSFFADTRPRFSKRSTACGAEMAP